MEKIIGVLGNITEKEMEIAIQAIEKSRDERTRVAKIKELEQTLKDTIDQIHLLNGRVYVNGGGYVPTHQKVNFHPCAQIGVTSY